MNNEVRSQLKGVGSLGHKRIHVLRVASGTEHLQIGVRSDDSVSRILIRLLTGDRLGWN